MASATAPSARGRSNASDWPMGDDSVAVAGKRMRRVGHGRQQRYAEIERIQMKGRPKKPTLGSLRRVYASFILPLDAGIYMPAHPGPVQKVANDRAASRREVWRGTSEPFARGTRVPNQTHPNVRLFPERKENDSR